jgi:hypothetical protein
MYDFRTMVHNRKLADGRWKKIQNVIAIPVNIVTYLWNTDWRNI